MDMSFSIPRGQIVGLLGPNFAGKSTTIAMLTDSLPQVAGGSFRSSSIFTRIREWHRALGAVLEDLSLFECLSLREQLRLTARLRE
jgi:ABC-type multidrug transport system ATPase subunit